MAIVYQFPNKVERENWKTRKLAHKQTKSRKNKPRLKLDWYDTAEQQAQSMSAEQYAEHLINHMISTLLVATAQDQDGIILDVSDLNTSKDIGLVMESLRSLIYRASGLEHPLQPKAEKYFEQHNDDPSMLKINFEEIKK